MEAVKVHPDPITKPDEAPTTTPYTTEERLAFLEMNATMSNMKAARLERTASYATYGFFIAYGLVLGYVLFRSRS